MDLLSNKHFIGAMLVLLDDMAPSPCHEFSHRRPSQELMSPEVLGDVLLLINAAQDGTLPLVVSIGSAASLDPAIVRTLKALNCELLVRQEVSKAVDGFGYFKVVVLNDDHDSDASQPVGDRLLYHVSPRAVRNLSQRFKPAMDDFLSLTLRAKELDRYQEADFAAYESQLVEFGEGLLRASSGGAVCSASNICSGQIPGCGAGVNLLTAGPDGLIYPCPAFYRAGPSHALASVRELGKEGWEGRIAQACANLDCRSCAFLHRTQDRQTTAVNRFAAAETRAQLALTVRAGQNGMLWHGLRSLEAELSRERSKRGCPDAYNPEITSDDVTAELFRQALRDIRSLANGLAAGTMPDSQQLAAIRQRWQPVPGESRQQVFRMRVSEIVQELCQPVELLQDMLPADRASAVQEADGRKPRGPRLTFPLDPESLADIRQRFAKVAAWQALSEMAVHDQADGFDCGDTTWLPAELAKAEARMQEWFDATMLRLGLDAKESWHCEVDLESSKLIVFRKESCSAMRPDPDGVKEKEETGEKLLTKPVPPAVFAMLQALYELQGTFADHLRCEIRKAARIDSDQDPISSLLVELGDVTLGLRAWYQDFARSNNWPLVGNWYLNLIKPMIILDTAASGLHPSMLLRRHRSLL